MKEKIISSPIIMALDWALSFYLIRDESGLELVQH